MKKLISLIAFVVITFIGCMDGWKPRFDIASAPSEDKRFSSLEIWVHDSDGRAAIGAGVELKGQRDHYYHEVTDLEGHALLVKVVANEKYSLRVHACQNRSIRLSPRVMLKAGVRTSIHVLFPSQGCEPVDID